MWRAARGGFRECGAILVCDLGSHNSCRAFSSQQFTLLNVLARASLSRCVSFFIETGRELSPPALLFSQT